MEGDDESDGLSVSENKSNLWILHNIMKHELSKQHLKMHWSVVNISTIKIRAEQI